MTKAIIYSDGGARGNPGPAGIGAVINVNGKEYFYKEYIGEATNNQAEYKAVILALEKAKELGVMEVDFFLDSELVQRQLIGKYKVKNQDLAPLFVRVWNLKQQFKQVKFHHILRDKNKQADLLVNQAIDGGLVKNRN